MKTLSNKIITTMEYKKAKDAAKRINEKCMQYDWDYKAIVEKKTYIKGDYSVIISRTKDEFKDSIGILEDWTDIGRTFEAITMIARWDKIEQKVKIYLS